jgi:hypothetical protein
MYLAHWGDVIEFGLTSTYESADMIEMDDIIVGYDMAVGKALPAKSLKDSCLLTVVQLPTKHDSHWSLRRFDPVIRTAAPAPTSGTGLAPFHDGEPGRAVKRDRVGFARQR